MRPNRWGTRSEISHVKRIPGKAFNALSRRLKHLASWSAMHLVRRHATIRKYARRRGVKPSSDLPLAAKIKYVTQRI